MRNAGWGEWLSTFNQA